MGQKVVKLMLEKIGFQVTLANNGKEAEENFFQNPSLFVGIILDYEMPIKSGIEATKSIREKDKSIPIVILTAHSTEKDKEECLESGANEFLTKPVTIKDLQSCLSRINVQ